MKGLPHDISFYMDGSVKVDYCRVCGAEGLELYDTACPDDYIEKELKKIDIDTEPY